MANHFHFFLQILTACPAWGADGAALAEQTEVERWDVGLHGIQSTH